MTLFVVADIVAATASHLGGGGVDIPVGRIIVSFFACLGIAVLAILFLRQRGGRTDLRATLGRWSTYRSAIDIAEVRRVSPYGDICVVRHDGREYLLLVQAGESRVLRERDIDGESKGPA